MIPTATCHLRERRLIQHADSLAAELAAATARGAQAAADVTQLLAALDASQDAAAAAAARAAAAETERSTAVAGAAAADAAAQREQDARLQQQLNVLAQRDVAVRRCCVCVVLCHVMQPTTCLLQLLQLALAICCERGQTTDNATTPTGWPVIFPTCLACPGGSIAPRAVQCAHRAGCSGSCCCSSRGCGARYWGTCSTAGNLLRRCICAHC